MRAVLEVGYIILLLTSMPLLSPSLVALPPPSHLLASSPGRNQWDDCAS
jgi:hypothetical protein